MDVNEIEFDVPWGKIAAKAWGDKKNPVVVALHGYQDNANTFDRLIPLLPQCYYYVCADLPSHGRSSHFETKTIPTHLDFVLALKILLDQIGRKKYILMGHSVSTRFGIFFTLMYPEYIKGLIALDATFYIPIEPENVIGYYKDIINGYLRIEKKMTDIVPTYTKNEAVEKILQNRFSSISENGAKILAERSLVPLKLENQKYRLSMAQHLKYMPRFPFGLNYITELFEKNPIKCPHLIILAKEGEGNLHKGLLNVFQKTNKNCEIYFVNGEHDVHLDHPERIGHLISNFLIKNLENSKL